MLWLLKNVTSWRLIGMSGILNGMLVYNSSIRLVDFVALVLNPERQNTSDALLGIAQIPYSPDYIYGR